MARTWTISEVARITGVTSRTLRYYDAIGLLPASEIATNGYRRYNASALVRLQRILALRELGMSLAHIAAVLDEVSTEVEALSDLEYLLVRESARLERQIASIRRTLATVKKGEIPVAHEMFDGFQHETYRDEVEERWRTQAWQASSAWWNALGIDERSAFRETVKSLNACWRQAAAENVGPGSDIAQALAARHVSWLRTMPQEMPAGEFREYLHGLGEMYVNDPRFAANYGGEAGAKLVQGALAFYAERHLS